MVASTPDLGDGDGNSQISEMETEIARSHRKVG